MDQIDLKAAGAYVPMSHPVRLAARPDDRGHASASTSPPMDDELDLQDG